MHGCHGCHVVTFPQTEPCQEGKDLVEAMNNIELAISLPAVCCRIHLVASERRVPHASARLPSTAAPKCEKSQFFVAKPRPGRQAAMKSPQHRRAPRRRAPRRPAAAGAELSVLRPLSLSTA